MTKRGISGADETDNDSNKSDDNKNSFLIMLNIILYNLLFSLIHIILPPLPTIRFFRNFFSQSEAI